MDHTRIPNLKPGQRHPDWMVLYEKTPEETLPWHLNDLDPDFSPVNYASVGVAFEHLGDMQHFAEGVFLALGLAPEISSHQPSQ